MASLNQLRRYHANMARLLHVLLRRHKHLEQGERPDFHLIREVVDYILEYMDGFIMPLERLYSEHLLAKEPEAEALSHRMADDYQALRKRLNLLSETLDMILMDHVVPMAVSYTHPTVPNIYLAYISVAPVSSIYNHIQISC